MIDSCVKSFPTQITSLNSVSNSLSCDVVRFKIKWGLKRNLIYVQKRNTKHTQRGHCHSSSKLRPAAMLAAAQSIPAWCHETKSPVWKSPLGELHDEKGRCYFIRQGATRSSQITLRTCLVLLKHSCFMNVCFSNPKRLARHVRNYIDDRCMQMHRIYAESQSLVFVILSFLCTFFCKL